MPRARSRVCRTSQLAAIEAGVQIDFDVSRVGSGSTPMHLAAGFGAYEVCKYLFELGGTDVLEAKNRKGKTPLGVAEDVGEPKVVRLLEALIKGEPPPNEVSDKSDDEDEVDELLKETTAVGAVADEGPPVSEGAPQAQSEAPAVPPTPQQVVAVAMSKMSIATFSIGDGKLGMTLEKNCVAKVGEAGTQAVTHGVQPGWVLRKIGDADAATETKAIMKQAAVALKGSADGVSFVFEAPSDEGVSAHCAGCDKFLPREHFDAAQLEAGPGKQRSRDFA